MVWLQSIQQKARDESWDSFCLLNQIFQITAQRAGKHMHKTGVLDRKTPLSC